MEVISKETIKANLEQEMRQSYLDYAMSVIVGRALPDVRDGLKPVHRRVLYAMSELGNDWNKAYKKSARIVGNVIGKYHPHGDTAAYDTIVRMAQSFSLRYPLVDGQGNFGSIDGDSAAAMRYTEIRLARIAHELLEDMDRETVDFGPNYDETEFQPLVLPARIPNMLVNGSSGIAVGMATNIPPHNLTEVINGCLALIDDPSLTADQLIEHIPGPDFPTSGIINGSAGIRQAYRTGRGRIYMRGRTSIESDEKGGRSTIIVHELPYQVNKARLLEKIAELVKTKKVEGISGLRDESDKAGMRMVIELRRGEVPEVVINNLYRQTQLEQVFGINMVALINNQPRTFTLKGLLDEFVRHRREVVTRRTIYDLRKARERAHLLEGLAVALSNIDPVIAMIKASANPAEARQRLMEASWAPGFVVEMVERSEAEMSRPDDLPSDLGLLEGEYHLSLNQAQAILDMRLHRLTGLEQEKIRSEYGSILDHITELLKILQQGERLLEVIRQELIEVRDRYGDERRTEIVHTREDLTQEDLIVEEDVVVTLSHTGYAKAQPLSDYRAQRRGGKGKSGLRMKDEDFVSKLFVANTHDTLLCFSSWGKIYWIKVYQLPQAGRAARGRPLVNLLPLGEDEIINAVLPVREYDPDHFIVMATAKGTIKKCALSAFSRPRPSGIRALELVEGDRLIGVGITDGSNDLMLFSDAGKAVRFSEGQVRPMGRSAKGVRGILLKGAASRVISMITLSGEAKEHSVLMATQKGYGKQTPVDQFPRKNRGGQGVISIQVEGRNGPLIGVQLVEKRDEVMLITDGGMLIRTRVGEISVSGRNTKGVRLINLGDDEALVAIERVDEQEEEAE